MKGGKDRYHKGQKRENTRYELGKSGRQRYNSAFCFRKTQEHSNATW